MEISLLLGGIVIGIVVTFIYHLFVVSRWLRSRAKRYPEFFQIDRATKLSTEGFSDMDTLTEEAFDVYERSETLKNEVLSKLEARQKGRSSRR